MKVYKLDDLIEEEFGPIGSQDRTVFEDELRLGVLGSRIRQLRKMRQMTQTELGERIGVKKSQISRIENNMGNTTIETLIRIFHALNARLSLKIDLFEQSMVEESGEEYVNSPHHEKKTPPRGQGF
jgi:HTH-type transcriptional regulator/antitoxin HipB